MNHVDMEKSLAVNDCFFMECVILIFIYILGFIGVLDGKLFKCIWKSSLDTNVSGQCPKSTNHKWQ